jgi:MFS family permease
LGWLFDGLDMHLYILVASPFVAKLLGVATEKDPRVGYYSSLIQAAFLIGWALGGGFFGRIASPPRGAGENSLSRRPEHCSWLQMPNEIGITFTIELALALPALSVLSQARSSGPLPIAS